MAELRNKVLFRFGSRAEYDALVEKDPNSLYFLLDTNELYRGEVPIGISHYYEGAARPNELIETTILRTLGTKIPVLNDLALITATDGIDDLFIYTENDTWKQLNAIVRSESVLFGDGETLAEKIEHLQSTIDVNEGALEIDEGILSVKNYGKQYYAYVAEVPAEGIEGEPGYVPAVPAHYELITVDADHPWKDGLTPRTDSNGDIAWYEPNLSRLDGINDTITSLQELIQNVVQVNNQQTQTLEELQADLSGLHELQAVVGTMGDPSQNTESTGLIKRVEDLENIGATGLGVKVNGVLLTPVNGAVNIPLFGADHDGVVPRFDSAVSSIEEANLNHLYLSANGWNDSIGDLRYNNTSYGTVTEYVDARIEDSTLQWQTIH